MLFNFAATILAAGSMVLATPLNLRAAVSHPFYLVSTPTRTYPPAAETAGLNLFDPYYQANYLLRAQPAAGSYSSFNLTQGGQLQTWAYPPHAAGPQAIYASEVEEDGDILFNPSFAGLYGGFSFDGRWLAYNGDSKGFTACDGALGQTVVRHDHRRMSSIIVN
jgi:hypothetical protein